MTGMTQGQMAEWDAGTREIMQQEASLGHALAGIADAAHRMAGDKRGARGAWALTDEEAMEALARRGGEPDPRYGLTAAALLARAQEATEARDQLRAQVRAREAAWDENGRWSRYFPCTSRDGHVHSSLRGCPTVRWDTGMAWAAEMSGLTADEAVHGVPGRFEGLGETLCSVCFPEAPAAWCRTRAEVTREQRDAARAARQEARYRKELRDGERFRDEGGNGRWVETVSRCKEILRDEVEYRDFYGRGEHPSHAASVADAAEAARVLLAREAARPGTGATREEISRIIERAVARNRKDGARI